jgi:hypothetical protein
VAARSDKDTEAKLKAFAQAVAEAMRNLERARAERDEAIRKASAAGLTRRKTAELANVTVGRVQQIVDKDDPTG